MIRKRESPILHFLQSKVDKYLALVIYRFGAQTEIGDIEISVWEAAMHRLIRNSGEEALYQALLAWVEADTPWLHTKKERELYALELHSARIFELPEWVAKQEFEENYMPKRD